MKVHAEWDFHRYQAFEGRSISSPKIYSSLYRLFCNPRRKTRNDIKEEKRETIFHPPSCYLASPKSEKRVPTLICALLKQMWNHSMIPPPFPPFLFTLHEWWNTFPPPFCVEKEAKKFRKNKIIKFHTLVLPFSLFSLQLNCFHPQTRCPPSFFHSIFLKLSWVVFLSFRCFVTCIFPLTSMGSLTLIWNISALDLDGNIFFELYFWNFFNFLFRFSPRLSFWERARFEILSITLWIP